MKNLQNLSSRPIEEQIEISRLVWEHKHHQKAEKASWRFFYCFLVATVSCLGCSVIAAYHRLDAGSIIFSLLAIVCAVSAGLAKSNAYCEQQQAWDKELFLRNNFNYWL